MKNLYPGLPLNKIGKLDWETKKMMFFPDSIDDTVKAVFLGYFGNGRDRKRNIEIYTPYTYKEVQKEVNKAAGIKEPDKWLS